VEEKGASDEEKVPLLEYSEKKNEDGGFLRSRGLRQWRICRDISRGSFSWEYYRVIHLIGRSPKSIYRSNSKTYNL
jgi:hypothetical protein